jgi:hypothetical protein
VKIARKSNEHLKQAFRHWLAGDFHQLCLDIWNYGEFDFFLDMLLMLRKRYKSEEMQSGTYFHMVEIYFDKYYNPNLLNPNLGEPRWDKYEWAMREAPKGKRISISDIFKDNG